MSKRGENIYKRKDNRWEGRYEKGRAVNGKRRLGYVYGKTYRETKIKLYIQYLKEQGRVDQTGGLSSKTIRDLYTILKSIIRYGEKEYGLPEIAANCRIPAREYKSSRVLTREEQEKLEEYLKRDPEDLKKLGVLLCLYTGLRLGEICALRWNEVDTESGFLQIVSTMQRIRVPNAGDGMKTQIVFGKPKSRTSLRTVPIPEFLCSILEKSKREAEEDAYILTGKNDQFMEPRNYQYHFGRYVRELGMEGIHFHTLRHTFATRCMEAGVDMKSLSEILGHAGTGITMDCYVHSSNEEKKRQMEKLDKSFSLGYDK